MRNKVTKMDIYCILLKEEASFGKTPTNPQDTEIYNPSKSKELMTYAEKIKESIDNTYGDGCDIGHDEIFFKGDICPLCEKIKTVKSSMLTCWRGIFD